MIKKLYAVYNTRLAPDKLKQRFPEAALYHNNELTLFAETLEQVTGTSAPVVVDLAALGFNHPYVETEQGLTAAELDAMVDQLLSATPTGREIQLNEAQGRYLYEARFKPVDQGTGG